MNELALFAGVGGGILGGKLLGWRTICAVEKDSYAASVLVARQNDGSLEPFPVWDDVRTFDGGPWSGIVDVVSGGFPCQDISAGGSVHGYTKGVEGGGEADCGERWQELLARFNQDSCLWKTAQCLQAEDFQESYQTFPKWGIMRNGELWGLTYSKPRIAGNGCGFLPTPVASEWKDKAKASVLRKLDRGGRLARRICSLWNLSESTKVAVNPRFSEWMMGWPIGWTELKPLETDKFRLWQATHGGF